MVISMRVSKFLLSLAGIIIATATLTVSGYDVDFQSWGTEEEFDSSESSFVELGSEVSAGVGEYEPSGHFANLTPHITYQEAINHCNATSPKLTLCPGESLCEDGVPLGGVRSTIAVVPVKDGVNQWLSVGPDRTCEVRDGKKWGTTAVYKDIKGLVACCNAEGKVKPSILSRWEGFLVKIANITNVWMVEHGVRRSIPSAKSFEAMGFHWQRIKTLPKSVVESIPLGTSLPDHDAEKNSNLFDHALLGYDHEGGNPFEVYEGYLVKKEGSSVICMIVHNSKRCIPDAETFDAKGFDYKFVQVVESWLYDSFPAGQDFQSRQGAAAGSEPYVHPLLGKEHFGASNLKSTIIGSTAFVKKSFKRMLDRDARPSELEFYLKSLRKNRDVPKLVRKLANSNPFLSKFVFPVVIKSLYSKILERNPTKKEFADLLQHFQAIRRSGDPTKNIKQIVLRFALSKEHMDKFVSGVSDKNQAIRNLYRHLLGRDAESTKVVESHAARVETEGWKAVVASFVDSAEYKSNVGIYGVPGDASLYAGPVRALYKKLLNVEDVARSVLESEAKEVAKDGWATYLEEFVKSRQYIDENSNDRFISSSGKTITLQPKKK